MLLKLPCWIILIALSAITLTGCAKDTSATLCIDQTPHSNGIDITNQCSQTIVVVSDQKERLIIPPGDTHRLLKVARQIGSCFLPDQPQIEAGEFSCK